MSRDHREECAGAVSWQGRTTLQYSALFQLQLCQIVISTRVRSDDACTQPIRSNVAPRGPSRADAWGVGRASCCQVERREEIERPWMRGIGTTSGAVRQRHTQQPQRHGQETSHAQRTQT